MHCQLQKKKAMFHISQRIFKLMEKVGQSYKQKKKLWDLRVLCNEVKF